MKKIIDWGKAPNWATHFGEENERYVAAWYRVDESGVREFASPDLSEHHPCCNPYGDSPTIQSLTPRPSDLSDVRKAILERDAAIKEMRADVGRFYSLDEVCAAILYEAGYRKTAQKGEKP